MNREQYAQLKHVTDALEADLYHPLGEIRLEGFRADGDLTLAEACKAEKHAMPEGTVWGGPGDYGWMFGGICVPEEAAGERIVMDVRPGGEATLFVDGHPFGTRRGGHGHIVHPHHYIVDQTLCVKAAGGERFSLAMEVYGGMPLPADPGRPVFPEEGVRFTDNAPARTGRSTFGVWNEEAYQLWLDLDMLRGIEGFLEENDCQKEILGACLGRLLDELDMEQPPAERRQAYIRARELLAPAMAARNGTFAPAMAVIGNSHLDLAWLWPLGETRRKTARTFAGQLRLLREYPEALFLQSQCAEYELCRRYYPEVFDEIRQAIASGQWIADGGMWVEPDTNMAGGEALIRQFLYGKRYFRDVLGVESRVAWLPDTFGYSAALPQILCGFHMEGLTTQKIFWSYNDAEPFPHHAFRWRGMDGSEIPCFLHMAYETKVDAETLHARWNARTEKDGSGDFFLPFGYGDGGGGPTRDDMEQIRRQKDLQGSPRLRWETPAEYLRERAAGRLPVYRGELYFPCHRGTYTTQAVVKKQNRTAENALRTWELLAAYAAFAKGAVYPAEEIGQAWKLLLMNQFHDILPGSSVAAVYERARREQKQVIDAAEAGARKAMEAFRTGDGGETVFNPSAHCARRTDNTPDGPRTVAVPALGARWSDGTEPDRTEDRAYARAENGDYVLENSRITVRLNGNGEVVSVVTAHDGQERTGGLSNRLHLYRDLPRLYDAWDIDSQTEDREVFPERVCRAEIVRAEGERAAVRFETRLSRSSVTQTVSLAADSFRVDFDTEVGWHERHRLLKVGFDTGIPADTAVQQIQFGFIGRPAHRSRRGDADRFEVCNHGYTALYDAAHGAAVLNDCKYGVGVNDGVISLSLLRAPTYPDAEADQGTHTFRYAYLVWDGAFDQSPVLAETDDLNRPVVRTEGRYDIPPLMSISSPCVGVESVKLAEDGSGDLIVRLFECMNGKRTAEITFPFGFASAALCDLEENELQTPDRTGNSVSLEFTPFSIRTLRLKR